MLTWEFMTIDIDFLMFSEFFWYVLLFWGFCRYMSHDHCSGGISMGLRTIGLHWGLLCCWTQYGKTVPSGASTWKLLQKSWRANDGCWWSNQLNTSMVLICQGFLNFCFFFFGETEPFGNLVIFSKKKNCIFWVFWGVPAGCLGVDGIPTGPFSARRPSSLGHWGSSKEASVPLPDVLSSPAEHQCSSQMSGSSRMKRKILQVF